MTDNASSLHTGLIIPTPLALIMGDFNICEPEEGRFNVGNQTFTDGGTGKDAMFHSSFLHVLEIAQPGFTRRDSSANMGHTHAVKD